MNMKELRERHGALVKLMDGVLAAAEGEKRTLKPDEASAMEKHRAELRSLEATIAALQEKESREAQGLAILSPKEIRQYSITGAIRDILNKKRGFETEISEHLAKLAKREADPMGFFVPPQIIMDPERRAESLKRQAEIRANMRALQATDVVQGGYTVGTDIAVSETVDLLRAVSTVVELGARTLTGLIGNVSIPRVLTGAITYWVSETGVITSSNPTFGQIGLKPRTLGASVPFTNQFLAQTSLSADSFINDDINQAFGTELDRVAIAGIGGAEPLGILNLPAGERAAAVTFGGAASWAKVIEFETNVANENANSVGSAYLTTPSVKGKWKAKPKETGQAVYLWENGDIVNGYRARASTNVGTADNKVIFGQFDQVVYGEWAGIQYIVDPYTKAKENQVVITQSRLVDCVVRQGKNFSVSTDSGAQ